MSMAEKAEDLNLPVSVVTRLIKDVLPAGVTISKEARVAITRCASVFVLFATATANTYSIKAKRKTLMASDIYDALIDMDFEEFVEPLKETVEAWRQNVKLHKKPKPVVEEPKQIVVKAVDGNAKINMIGDSGMLRNIEVIVKEQPAHEDVSNQVIHCFL
ncbi:unnamed protein product [Soboliphyme baturini]|uniref:DNA polymerase epsilon subunit 3 n=1 Tax=Soboliphyme baturini TaxID=241478 RepID=A0A183INC3_9BILA|nr:unnamed protein product [Soboliphyme baturini]